MTKNQRESAPLPVTLSETLIPLDASGVYVPHHRDAADTVHWLSTVDAPEGENPNGEAYQVRYFRAAFDEARHLVHDSYPVIPVADRATSPFPLLALQLMLEDGDVENAQELAQLAAETYGLAFPDPADLPALSRSAQAQEAAFIAAHGDQDTEPLVPVAVERDPAVEHFRAQFVGSAYRLLEPVDPTVNYSLEVVAADPWTLELSADKWWLDENGQMGHAGQPIRAYPLEGWDADHDSVREEAGADRDALHHLHREEGLEAVMHKAESLAVAHHLLDPNRADGRLFEAGPPDRFVTLREAELSGLELPTVVEDWRDITADDTQPMPAVTPQPGSWEEQVLRDDLDEDEPERHYWQMHTLPVETPDGERLGTALFVTEFPQLPPDFDAILDEDGMDDSIYPTQARVLEMAHFASDDDARKFEAEFRSYLVPGLLDAPELAPEVAKLEGLSGEWEDMDYRGIVDYMSGSRTIVREADNWRLHSSNLERGTRAAAEGLFPDSLSEIVSFTEDTSEQAPASPDFDL